MHNNIYSERVVIEILIEVPKSTLISGGFRGGGGGGARGAMAPRDFLLQPYLFILGYIVLKSITIQLYISFIHAQIISI